MSAVSPRIPAGLPALVAVAVIASGLIACGEEEPASFAEPLEDAGGGPPDDGDGDSSPATPADAGENGPGVSPTEIRPCDADLNPYDIDPPAADFEQQDYRFDLESETLRSVEGTVISAVGIDNPGVIDRAVFVGTGMFLDEGCITTQNGTSYSWRGVACQTGEGTLFNVFLIEPEKLSGLSRLVRRDMTVRMTGYEIERFNDFSPGGGYWQDGGDNGDEGQTSLWLTDVCLVE